MKPKYCGDRFQYLYRRLVHVYGLVNERVILEVTVALHKTSRLKGWILLFYFLKIQNESRAENVSVFGNFVFQNLLPSALFVNRSIYFFFEFENQGSSQRASRGYNTSVIDMRSGSFDINLVIGPWYKLYGGDSADGVGYLV